LSPDISSRQTGMVCEIPPNSIGGIAYLAIQAQSPQASF
jgi:hypothetical protein